MGYLWLVGAFLSIIGSVCSNLGVNTQKYAFMQDPPSDFYWWFGLLLVIVGSLGDFSALALAPQSVVAPIGAVTLVANLFFAHLGLGEDLGWVDVAGVGLIVFGAVLAVIMGSRSSPTITLDLLTQLYGEPKFIMYVVLCSGLLGLEYFMLKMYIEPLRKELDGIIVSCKGWLDDHDDTPLDDAEKEALRVKERKAKQIVFHDDFVVAEEAYMLWENFHAFAYCSLSGITGSFSMLCAKSVSELLRATFEGKGSDIWGRFLTYPIIIGMFFFIFCQLHFLSKGLSYFDALYVVPVFQCFFITFSVLGGMVYFKEYQDFETTNWIGFPTGVGITLFGVYVLSMREFTKDEFMYNLLPDEPEQGRASPSPDGKDEQIDVEDAENADGNPEKHETLDFLSPGDDHAKRSKAARRKTVFLQHGNQALDEMHNKILNGYIPNASFLPMRNMAAIKETTFDPIIHHTNEKLVNPFFNGLHFAIDTAASALPMNIDFRIQRHNSDIRGLRRSNTIQTGDQYMKAMQSSHGMPPRASSVDTVTSMGAREFSSKSTTKLKAPRPGVNRQTSMPTYMPSVVDDKIKDFKRKQSSKIFTGSQDGSLATSPSKREMPGSPRRAKTTVPSRSDASKDDEAEAKIEVMDV